MKIKMKTTLLCLALLSCTLFLVACDGKNSTSLQTEVTTHSSTEMKSETHVHSFGSWETVKAPTCTEAGSQERFCVCGERQESALAATGHLYGDWEIVEEATCMEDGSRVRTCVCGKKETETLPQKGYHTYGMWMTTKHPTCTEEGIFERSCECGEKETRIEPAMHHYNDGVCTDCKRGVINIIIPEMPKTTYDSDTGLKITSLTIEKIEFLDDSRYKITFLFSGEQIYNEYGSNTSASCSFAYKIYDSDGYVVLSQTAYSEKIKLGEKFRDREFSTGYQRFNNKETYTLEILDIVL